MQEPVPGSIVQLPQLLDKFIIFISSVWSGGGAPPRRAGGGWGGGGGGGGGACPQFGGFCVFCGWWGPPPPPPPGQKGTFLTTYTLHKNVSPRFFIIQNSDPSLTPTDCPCPISLRSVEKRQSSWRTEKSLRPPACVLNKLQL